MIEAQSFPTPQPFLKVRRQLSWMLESLPWAWHLADIGIVYVSYEDSDNTLRSSIQPSPFLKILEQNTRYLSVSTCNHTPSGMTSIWDSSEAESWAKRLLEFSFCSLTQNRYWIIYSCMFYNHIFSHFSDLAIYTISFALLAVSKKESQNMFIIILKASWKHTLISESLKVFLLPSCI